jgi:hypothetical protein
MTAAPRLVNRAGAAYLTAENAVGCSI